MTSRIPRILAIILVLGAALALTATQALAASTSSGHAPAPSAAAVREPGPAPNPLFVTGSQAYAFDIYPGSNMVTFDSATPGSWTVVGAIPGQQPFAGDFKTGERSTLYAIDYGNNKLFAYDVTNATRTEIATATPADLEMWTGMTGGPDGTMYVSSTNCGVNSTLYTIDLATGAVTTIGSITNGDCIIDIAMNSAGELYGVEIVSDNLVRIDPSTGAGTVVGLLGINANSAQGMDFDDATGTLYWAAYNFDAGQGELRTIDTSTGASTLVGAFPGGAEVDCLAFVPPPLFEQKSIGLAHIDQDFETAHDSWDCIGADDFATMDPWDITKIYVPGRGNQLTNAGALHWYIYRNNAGLPDGNPMTGGNPPVWSLSLPPSDSQVTIMPDGTSVILNLNTPVHLQPGTYWFLFRPELNYTTYGSWYWDGSSASLGYNAKWINPGGGWGFGSSWNDMAVFTSGDTSWAFRLDGKIGIALGDAVEQSSLTWDLYGVSDWFGQTAVTHDGVDAAQTGAIGNSQITTMETHTADLSQTTFLTFWWKVSSEPNFDFLRFFVDGEEKASISGIIDWAQVQVVLAPGVHVLTWTYAKDGFGSAGDDAGWVDQVDFAATSDLGEAVDQPSLTWNTSGDGYWYGETTVTQDGVDAAQSGVIGDNQSESLQTTTESFAQPTLLTFWWKVSSELGDDFLRFYIDGVEQERITGEVDWTLAQAVLSPGSHTLAWTYDKGASGSAGSDAGWLDQVTFNAPLFYDSFSDGNLAGDPQWVKLQGVWKVKSLPWNGGKLYFSSPAGRALSKVKNFTTDSAQVRARFKIGSTLAWRSVSFAFDIKSRTRYRYVEIKQLPTGKWMAYLKQKGTFDGAGPGIKGSAALTGFNRTAVHNMRLDIYADGDTVAWLDGKMLFDKSFGAGGTGSLGLKSDFTTLYVDDYTVYDGSVLP